MNTKDTKIRDKKRELKKYKKELGFYEETIGKISRMFKYKSIAACKNKFNNLFENRNKYRKEISDFIKKLSKNLDKYLNHVLIRVFHQPIIQLKDFIKLQCLKYLKENS